MSIFIVRHGEDFDNEKRILNGWRNKPLTKKGRKQARSAGRTLKKENIAAIYSSPLLRARQTAEIIKKELKLDKITINNDLKERNFGVLTGKPAKEIEMYSKNNKKYNGLTYFLAVQGSEPYPALYKRAKKVLINIKKANNKKNIVIVSHGEIGSMIVSAQNKWTWGTGIKRICLKNGEIYKLTN